MSEHDVALVRRWFELYNARDMDRLAEVCHPDFEKHSVFAGLSGGIFRGPDRFPEDYFAAIDEAYERFVLELVELTQGESAVMATTDAHWRGRGSGVEGTRRLFIVFWSRGERLIRDRTFNERAEALAAAARPIADDAV